MNKTNILLALGILWVTISFCILIYTFLEDWHSALFAFGELFIKITFALLFMKLFKIAYLKVFPKSSDDNDKDKINKNKKLTKDWYNFRFDNLVTLKELDSYSTLLNSKAGEEFIFSGLLEFNAWNIAMNNLNKNIIVSENNIQDGFSNKKKLNCMFDEMVGVSLKSRWDIIYEYNGDAHGGACKYTAISENGKESAVWEALNLKPNNLNGLIELFCLILEMPKKGVYWHDLYDLDYSFLRIDDHLLFNILKDKEHKKPFDKNLINLMKIHTGLRISKEGDFITLKCLSYKNNSGIVDYCIKFNETLTSLETISNVLLDTKTKTLY